jgi:class 3 adenylate cyclase
MDAPRIKYATAEDGTQIAYGIVGSGPPLLLADRFVGGRLDTRLASGRYAGFHEGLAQSRTLIVFDWRNGGLSGRARDLSLRALTSDLRAVVDDAGFERLDIVGVLRPRDVAMSYAADHPDRIRRLVVIGGFNRGGSLRSNEVGAPIAHLIRDHFDQFAELYALHSNGWNEAGREAAEDFKRHWTGESFSAFMDVVESWDSPRLAHRVKCPVLLIAQPNTEEAVRDLARSLSGGQIAFAPLDFTGPALPKLILDFLGEFPAHEAAASQEHDALAAFRTILFTDLEAHTAMMQRLGDAKGREVLREHERISREALRAHGGTEVKTIGDSFMASFPSAQKAVECAIALQRAFESAECAGERLRIRVGINAGEPIAEEDDLFGSSVILASRTKEKAAGGEIFVTDVVRQLVAGKGFAFADRGEMEMKGFEEPVRLYEVRWQEAAS